MTRRLSALLLAVGLAFPSAGEGSAAARAGGEDGAGRGGTLLWATFTLLSGAMLAASLIDWSLYDSRADDLSAAGEEADPYRAASSREKVMIGLSAATLVVSLAGLRGTLRGRNDAVGGPVNLLPAPAAGPAIDGSGGAELLSHEASVRYDTLFALPAHAGGNAEAPVPEGASLPMLDRDIRRDTVAAPLPGGEESLAGFGDEKGIFTRSGVGGAPGLSPGSDATTAPREDDPVALLIGELEGAASALPPAREEAPPAEEKGPATFTLLPYAVHVTSFRTLDRAEEDEERWRGRGVRAVIEEDELEGKGTWFRVLLGNFEHPGEARAFAEEIASRYDLPYAQVRKRSGF